jgi:hypothetical protein
LVPVLFFLQYLFQVVDLALTTTPMVVLAARVAVQVHRRVFYVQVELQ